MQLSNRWSILAIMLIAPLGGCAERGPEMRLVTGTVSYDGVPVDEGQVIFRDVDGSHVDGGQIVDGSFEFKASVGKKIVSFDASRDTGQTADGVPVRERVIPLKYGPDSTETAEVVADGDNDFDFSLKK